MSTQKEKIGFYEYRENGRIEKQEHEKKTILPKKPNKSNQTEKLKLKTNLFKNNNKIMLH